MDYYTGMIFETVVDSAMSICSGGRYDNLIGMFVYPEKGGAGLQIPAVGFGLGFDRTIEAMEDLELFPKNLQTTKVLVPNTSEKSAEIASKLRDEGVNTELYPEQKDLEKQLKYADKKQIPYCVIAQENNLILKDMQKRTQETLTFPQILQKLKL